ncbi:shikimate dehydrogenase [Helicobacter fennelliae]|uniref:Shikimate dehydrogenase (NADP(+)) n=1 Tax=Helicobacter fennelliae MRY12-0050 TaxID=1325130 RepID=T1DWU6_9HELI|nr:shikimate dehydrogenase [Helicobacter fennelliae]GAD19938.1 shikimate 5-dehydrogenase I alpha [Helicobacter fennelliae MRY12-0050]STP06940.1 shikimate 5-dehydrogenase [Helicobacter fennelliae]STQ83514.1 shikimate 5-dehydrogenase [Helicobacter fennelliae]
MKQFCVFGNPIAHSLSPLIHNAILQSLNLPYLYGRFHLQEAKHLKATFLQLKLSGANITLPFKEQAFRQADEVRGIAQEIGAVNTFVYEDGKIIGYNTDALGFWTTIKDKNIQTALLIGAGGSAKAIALILKQNNINVFVTNRSTDKAHIFEEKNIPFVSQDKLLNTRYDLIINATSATLHNTLPLRESLLYPLFESAKIAYDLMYGGQNIFLDSAKRHNLHTQDGQDMLIWQAIFALQLFCPELSQKLCDKEAYRIMSLVCK